MDDQREAHDRLDKVWGFQEMLNWVIDVESASEVLQNILQGNGSERQWGNKELALKSVQFLDKIMSPMLWKPEI